MGISGLSTEALSIKSLQQLSVAVDKDAAKDPEIVSSLGRQGRHSQNIEREFHNRMSTFLGVGLKTYEYDAPTIKCGAVSVHRHSCILPHEIFSHLYTWDKDMFHRVFFGAAGAAADFWHHMQHIWRPAWFLEHRMHDFIITPG